MNITQIEENIKALIENLIQGQCKQDDFIYELLLAYGHRKQSVTRLRSGERNLAFKGSEFNHSEIIWKRHLYFKQVEGGELLAEIDQMYKEKLVATNKIRFVIVTDFDQLFAHDLKTNDRLDISLDELPNKFDFFLPWAGMEKAVYQGENPADVKAAEKMAKLFDLIKDDNFDESNKDDTEALHGLNVFLTRLLFCFFAEDTEIFADNQFSNAIQSHTKDDGSDLSDYLNRLFTVLNTSGNSRGELPDYLSNFPYVNGGLFATDISSPSFTAKSRRMLIECGSELDWSDINPDIFGSMIQAVVHPDQRGGMGMHYTSVTNIMKVIEPLFLNDLYDELEKSESSAAKLQKMQQRLAEIKIFDPACGSGNFLIIAYKELRKLEMEVLKRLQEIEAKRTGGQISQPFSVIKLSQFYGIELDDFAHEVAILSLWLAEHQMNVEFKAEFGEAQPSLPLRVSGEILSGNSAEVSWSEVCPANGEIYILGNPPYLGQKEQNKQQKEDVNRTCNELKGHKNFDYICCWFVKAAQFISESNFASFAFVTTNSICQGHHAASLWPYIHSKGLEIGFAHKQFAWTNSAKGKAAVICSIVGVRKKSEKKKNIYTSGLIVEASNINSYLIDHRNIYITGQSKPISRLPKMDYGNRSLDDGHLLLTPDEKEKLIEASPEASVFIKKFCGSREFINGIERYCLWIEDSQIDEALDIKEINDRVRKVADFRKGGGQTAQSCAHIPHKFSMVKRAEKSQLIIPLTSSQRREYIPTGFLGSEIIVSQTAQVIYDPDPYVFSLVNSHIHMVWLRALAGRLKSDYRYSSSICYNSFPFLCQNDDSISTMRDLSFEILNIREKFPDKTLADLYDPQKMPDSLRSAHKKNNEYVESLFSAKALKSDSEILVCLFDLYEKMTGGLNA